MRREVEGSKGKEVDKGGESGAEVEEDKDKDERRRVRAR